MEPSPALAKLTAARPPQWTWCGSDCIHDLRWAPHGHTLIAASLSGELVCLDGATGKPRWHLPEAHPGGTLWCASHPSEPIVASGGQDGAVRLWNANQGTLIRTLFADRKRWVEQGAWSADGSFLAVAAGKGISFWSVSGEARGLVPEQKATIASLAWHPRENQLLVGTYGGVSIWIPGQEKAVSGAEWPTAVMTAQWSPRGDWVAAGTGDASIQVWRVGTDETLRMAGYAGKVREVAWHPNGRYLSTGGGFNVVCWDFAGEGPEGSTPQEWMGHSERISAVAAHPTDSEQAASVGRDQLLFVWELGKADPIALRAVPQSVPHLLAWQPNGKTIVAGCEGGDVVCFKMGK